MSFFDEVKKLAGEHPNELKTGLDKLGGVVDRETGGKYHDQIGKAEQTADNVLDKNATGHPPQQQPQQPTPPSKGA